MPDARQAWAGLHRQNRLVDVDPGTLAYHDKTCRIALALGDTRQQAYAQRNRWQFARDHHRPHDCADARSQRARLLQAEPALKRLPAGEHYPLPRLPAAG